MEYDMKIRMMNTSVTPVSEGLGVEGSGALHMEAMDGMMNTSVAPASEGLGVEGGGALHMEAMGGMMNTSAAPVPEGLGVEGSVTVHMEAMGGNVGGTDVEAMELFPPSGMDGNGKVHIEAMEGGVPDFDFSGMDFDIENLDLYGGMMTMEDGYNFCLSGALALPDMSQWGALALPDQGIPYQPGGDLMGSMTAAQPPPLVLASDKDPVTCSDTVTGSSTCPTEAPYRPAGDLMGSMTSAQPPPLVLASDEDPATCSDTVTGSSTRPSEAPKLTAESAADTLETNMPATEGKKAAKKRLRGSSTKQHAFTSKGKTRAGASSASTTNRADEGELPVNPPNVTVSGRPIRDRKKREPIGAAYEREVEKWVRKRSS
jgi:hypothetical protein